MVRNAVSQKKEGAPKAEAEKAEPAKKKLTAVFRPQNAKQQIKRPVPKEQPKPQQAAPKTEENKTSAGSRSKDTGTGDICSGSGKQTCTDRKRRFPEQKPEWLSGKRQPR